MPHRINDSNSTLNSGSTNDRVLLRDMRGSNPIPRKSQPPVIVHNKGGQIYDETRPSDWDHQRWK